MAKCAACGQENTDEARFCSGCGAAMPQPEAPPAQTGEPVPPPVAPVPPISEPPAPVVQPAAPPPTPAAPPAAAPVPTVPAAPPAGAPVSPAPAKKSTWWWWACGGCGCLVVVALIVGAIVWGMRAANQVQQKVMEGAGTQTTVPGTKEGVEFGGDTSGPHVKAMRVGDTYDEEKQQVSNVLSQFPPDAPEIHMDADLAGLTTGAAIKAALIAVSVIDTEGSLIQNQEVTSVDWEAPDAEAGVHATFTAPDNGWPVGEYVIELSVDGNKIDEAEFMVQAGEGLNQPRTP